MRTVRAPIAKMAGTGRPVTRSNGQPRSALGGQHLPVQGSPRVFRLRVAGRAHRVTLPRRADQTLVTWRGGWVECVSSHPHVGRLVYGKSTHRCTNPGRRPCARVFKQPQGQTGRCIFGHNCAGSPDPGPRKPILPSDEAKRCKSGPKLHGQV